MFSPKTLLYAAAIAAAGLTFFSLHSGYAAPQNAAVQTKAQLQEELGEALQHYYLYGDNKSECDKLLELIETKN